MVPFLLAAILFSYFGLQRRAWPARRDRQIERKQTSEGSDYLESLPRRWVTVYVPLLVFLFVLLFPFYWMGMTAFKPNAEMVARAANPFLDRPSDARQFRKAAVPYAVIRCGCGTQSDLSGVDQSFRWPRACLRRTRSNGCAFAAPGRRGLAIFLAYLVPPSILFIPLAAIVVNLGLFDTRWALILTYPTFLIPFCTWLLMGYFRSIPYELEECALIDGATRWQVLTRSSCLCRFPD